MRFAFIETRIEFIVLLNTLLKEIMTDEIVTIMPDYFIIKIMELHSTNTCREVP